MRIHGEDGWIILQVCRSIIYIRIYSPHGSDVSNHVAICWPLSPLPGMLLITNDTVSFVCELRIPPLVPSSKKLLEEAWNPKFLFVPSIFDSGVSFALHSIHSCLFTESFDCKLRFWIRFSSASVIQFLFLSIFGSVYVVPRRCWYSGIAHFYLNSIFFCPRNYGLMDQFYAFSLILRNLGL